MAIDLGTTVDRRCAAATSCTLALGDVEPEPAVVPLDVDDPAAVTPAWARYVAGVVAELRPAVGFDGQVITTLPIGAGLSSSAALEVAVALALGFEGTPLELAQLCQRAEQRASGVPCGIMDQLASAAGVDGHALRIDCTSLDVEPGPDARRPRGRGRRLRRAASARDERLRRAGGRSARPPRPRSGRCATPRSPTSSASTTRSSGDGPATSSPRTSASTRSPRRCASATAPRIARRDGGEPRQPAGRLRGEHAGARRPGRTLSAPTESSAPASPVPASAAAWRHRGARRSIELVTCGGWAGASSGPPRLDPT